MLVHIPDNRPSRSFDPHLDCIMNSSNKNIVSTKASETPGLNLYLLFVASWFMHIPARLEFLGTIRFDLLLVCMLMGLVLTRGSYGGAPTQAGKVLQALIVYAIMTIPFVYWPGSVIKSGFPNFIKAVVFFYFTIAFVRTEADLKKFLFVFVSFQALRILEPLYLHTTEGYWGSAAHMGGSEFLARLSGAPSDVINPNGLAFVVCTVLPFLYFMAGISLKFRLAAMLLVPLCLYALFLTGSRSGIIGLLVLILGIAAKAKSRVSSVAITIVALVIVGVGFTFLDADLQDRYLSIVGEGEKNVATADERMEGMEYQYLVFLHRPIVGHGLGTSAEANRHFTTSGPYADLALPAHNLFLEIGQELGVFGLFIFLLFIKAIFSGFAQSRKVCRDSDSRGFLARLIDAMQVWLAMNVVFSFASYGLSSYEWYLFGGLSVVVQRLSKLDPVGDPQMKKSGSR
jgi:putative inorganic carbon (hco3(-)) transporter